MKDLLFAGALVAAAAMACTAMAHAQDSGKAPDGDDVIYHLLEERAAADEGNSDAETPSSATAAADSRPPVEIVPLPAIAIEPEPALQARQSGSLLEEVVVTARRREESLQDVAISMTVFNQQQLDNANITNAADIATYTPSLSANTRFGTETATFSIRGFTQDLRTTASVATYFAEVVAPRGQTVQTSGDGAGPGAFFDLQNVQVLKGPQGTLFGRNTTGGAVLLVPHKPTHNFDGYVELSGGELGTRRGQAVLNVPATDRFRLRFGVDMNKRDGHLRNFTGIGTNRLGNTDYSAFRFGGVLDITESLENYLILTYVDSETAGQTAQLFTCNDSPLESPLSLLTGPACRAQLDEQEATGRDGPYDVASTIATPLSRIRERRLINTTIWQATDNLAVKNIIAYSHLYTVSGSGIFGTRFTETLGALLEFGLPLGLVDPNRELAPGATVVRPGVPVTSQATFVEEIQLQGTSFDDRLTWQTGAYYENSRPDGLSGGRGWSFVYCDPASLEGDPSQFNCFDPMAGLIGGVIDQDYKVAYLNRAVYAQATFDILEQLSVTGGIRYTWDKTRGQGTRTRYSYLLNIPLPPIVSELSATAESEAPTGLVELSYKPVHGTMVYAKYIRGYRQGSVNMAADPGINTWDPETVNTYEIGAKTSFGGPVPGRFNIAAFYNDLTDMQLQVGYVGTNTSTTTAIFNAGKARVAGTEVEAFFQLTEDLTASLSYAYLDTKLLEQADRQAEVLAAGGLLAGLTYSPIAVVGDSLPFASDHAVVAMLNYRLPLSYRVGPINLGATYVYTGKQRVGATGTTPFDVLDDFSLLNLNLNWLGMFGSPLDLAIFVTNVLDDVYSTYNSATFNALGFESRQPGLPRMIGARLKYSFGQGIPG